MAESSTARAYSSIANLGHGLDVLGVCVDIASDEVSVSFGDRGLSITVEGKGYRRISTDPQRNTAGVAVTALLTEKRIDRGLNIHVIKGIPPASGLGSSAASAVAAVAAAADLLKVELSPVELVRLAAEGERAAAGAPHADNVAASALGGFVIVHAGGDFGVTTASTNPAVRFAVVTPRVEVPTIKARAALPADIPLSEYVAGCSAVARIITALTRGDSHELGNAAMGSFVDQARASLIPRFHEAVRAARSSGASGVMISGGGPSLAAVVPDEQIGSQVVAGMIEAFATGGIEAAGTVARIAGGVEILTCAA